MQIMKLLLSLIEQTENESKLQGFRRKEDSISVTQALSQVHYKEIGIIGYSITKWLL